MDYKHFEEDVKRKMIVSDYKSSCMTEAGAGAGKTTIIISRVLKQLKEAYIKPEELVIITFTKAAAGELRDRLSKALKNEIEKEENETYKKNLQYAIDNQSLIQVSTIHSFCFRLIKERALDANLPLDIEMLEDCDNEARIDDFFKKWYKMQDSEEIKKYEKEFYLRNYSKYVYECYKEIVELPNDMVFKYKEELLDDNNWKLEDYKEAMKLQTNRLFNQIFNSLKINNDLALSNIKELHTDKKGPLKADSFKMKDILLSNNKYIIFKAYKDASKGLNFGSTFINKSLNEEKKLFFFTKGYEACENDILNFFKNEENLSIKLDYYQNALVVKKAIEARCAYLEELKKKENKHVISNDNLLQMALSLVKNEDALAHFQKEFKYIYVDEFQDTDTVQRDLIYLLSKGKDKKFRDGCFFLVGDPKQSIYAFRGADLSVYENTKNELMSEKIDNVFFYYLQRNHRSEEKIINWVNEEFKKDYGIGKDYLEMTYAHEGKNDEFVLNGVYTLNNPKAKADFYKKKKDNIEKESEFLVELIKKIKKDYKINEFKKVDGKFIPTYRNITNKDFLVLSPKKPVLEVYAEKLKEAGIPINLYGALDLANDPAVLRFKALYHYLINPNDRKALYGAKEIFAQNYITKQNNKDASERLEKFKSECENKLPHELLEYLSHHVEYFMDKNTNKSQVVYLESRLQQLLEYLLSYGILNASDYDSLIDKYMKSGVDKELSIVQGEDAVRLMNLHKSKGLEGKIVIVLARCKEQNDKNDSYRNMYEYYPSIKSGAMGSVISSYNPYTDEDGINPALSRKSEKKRLEYVEATRAEEALIFFDALDSNCIFSDYNFDKAINLCSIDNDIDYLYNKILEENKHVSISNIEYKEKDIPEDNFNIHINDYQKTKDYINASPSDFEQEYKDDWTPASENRPMGACFGTILHRVFELAVLSIRENKNVDKSKIINQSMIESLIELENEDKNYFSYHLREYPKYLMNLLDNFINSDLIKEIKCAKYVYPEYKFNIFIDANESKECIDILKEGKYYLNGKADLVLVNEDHILVVDYKTDHKGDYSNQELYKHLEDTYSNQQRMYCVALSKCFKIDRDKINYKFYHLYN